MIYEQTFRRIRIENNIYFCHPIVPYWIACWHEVQLLLHNHNWPPYVGIENWPSDHSVSTLFNKWLLYTRVAKFCLCLCELHCDSGILASGIKLELECWKCTFRMVIQWLMVPNDDDDDDDDDAIWCLSIWMNELLHHQPWWIFRDLRESNDVLNIKLNRVGEFMISIQWKNLYGKMKWNPEIIILPFFAILTLFSSCFRTLMIRKWFHYIIFMEKQTNILLSLPRNIGALMMQHEMEKFESSFNQYSAHLLYIN